MHMLFPLSENSYNPPYHPQPIPSVQSLYVRSSTSIFKISDYHIPLSHALLFPRVLLCSSYVLEVFTHVNCFSTFTSHTEEDVLSDRRY